MFQVNGSHQVLDDGERVVDAVALLPHVVVQPVKVLDQHRADLEVKLSAPFSSLLYKH